MAAKLDVDVDVDGNGDVEIPTHRLEALYSLEGTYVSVA